MSGGLYQHEIEYQHIRDAAPDLLAALEAMLEGAENGAFGEYAKLDPPCELMARAAIAKARGEV